MCVSGWPAGKYTYLRRKTLPRRAARYNYAKFWAREIRIVVPDNAILVEKKRVLIVPNGEVPVYGSRDYRSIRIR